MGGGETKRRFSGDWRLSRRREKPTRGSARRAMEDGVHFPGHLQPDPYRNRFPPNWAVVGAVALAAAALYAWGF
ncbi:MAG: hypothetical protein J6Y19_06720, partial [Kiritimatiellae bacterium]|nr:hypothetical protein [Kiritimatiellia bacterium]